MDERTELSPEEKDRLRQRLCILSDGVAHGKQPEVTVTCRGDGGYRTHFVKVAKVDWPGRRLLPVKETEHTPEEIPFGEILWLQSAVMELLEDPDGFLDPVE